jgi:hypothetical protein
MDLAGVPQAARPRGGPGPAAREGAGRARRWGGAGGGGGGRIRRGEQRAQRRGSVRAGAGAGALRGLCCHQRLSPPSAKLPSRWPTRPPRDHHHHDDDDDDDDGGTALWARVVTVSRAPPPSAGRSGWRPPAWAESPSDSFSSLKRKFKDEILPFNP